MTKISTLPNRKQVQEEAAQWLIKLDGDEAPSKQDLLALKEWLSRSPVHRHELNTLNAFWGNNILTELVVPLGKHEPNVGLLKSGLGWLTSFQGMAVASAFSALMLFLFMFLQEPSPEMNGFYATAVGQQKTITLEDGSVLQLNTDSQIDVRYTDEYRNIHLLQGEVHFDVSKDKQRPFNVYAGIGRIQAIGTEFTVYLKKKDVDILVTEGQVALDAITTLLASATRSPDTVKADSDKLSNSNAPERLGLLSEGQSVTLNIQEVAEGSKKELIDTIEVVETEKLTQRQAWRKGMLVFSGETLEQVVEEISRYTTMSIEIADPEVRNIQIGGRFKVGDVDNMFQALEANFGLEVERISYNKARLKLAD